MNKPKVTQIQLFNAKAKQLELEGKTYKESLTQSARQTIDAMVTGQQLLITADESECRMIVTKLEIGSVMASLRPDENAVELVITNPRIDLRVEHHAKMHGWTAALAVVLGYIVQGDVFTETENISQFN